MPEDIRKEERELERRLEERVRKKKGKAAAKRDEHHFNDPVLISVLHGLQGLSHILWFLADMKHCRVGLFEQGIL